MAEEEKEQVFEEEKQLLHWVGLERPFKQRPREFFSTVLVLALLVGIILFFIEGLMPVLVVGAVTFMVFVLYKTEPGKVEYAVTSFGVGVGSARYRWEEFIAFWFEDKWGSRVLNLQTVRPVPGLVMMVLPGEGDKSGVSEEDFKKALLKYLPMEKPEPGWADKAVSWVSKKVPLEE